MIDTCAMESTVILPYRYHATAAAFIEATRRAREAPTTDNRRQHAAVARVWYEMLEESLRALKREAVDTRAWIGDHDAHPLLPQMRSHLSSLTSDARMLDRALTDLLTALSMAGTGSDV